MAIREAILLFCEKRMRKQAPEERYIASPQEVVRFIVSHFRIPPDVNGEFSIVEQRKLKAAVWPTFKSIWKDAGGLSQEQPRQKRVKKRKKYRLKWPNQLPVPSPVTLSERDSRMRTLRRMITIRERRILALDPIREQQARSTVLEELRLLKSELAGYRGVEQPRTGITLKLPRQNYDDAT